MENKTCKQKKEQNRIFYFPRPDRALCYTAQAADRGASRQRHQPANEPGGGYIAGSSHMPTPAQEAGAHGRQQEEGEPMAHQPRDGACLVVQGGLIRATGHPPRLRACTSWQRPDSPKLNGAGPCPQRAPTSHTRAHSRAAQARHPPLIVMMILAPAQGESYSKITLSISSAKSSGR